jgi:hypothetical protein
MSSSLTILFRRDPSRDRRNDNINFEGYQLFWPDGRPVAVGLDAFCTQGQRLLGLGRQLRGCQEKLLQILCLHLPGQDADLTRIPGHRVRRFYIERNGDAGRVHFMDGTPTTAVFVIGRDETVVLEWLGLLDLEDGQRQWFDVAAIAADAEVLARPLAASCEV